MFRWMKSKLHRKPPTPPVIDIGGMEPGLDEYALEQRQECIDEIVESGKSHEEAVKLADSWFIMQVTQQLGGREPTQKYVPRPIWDWDWAWRQMFDTREEAEAHVESKRGLLLDADLQP